MMCRSSRWNRLKDVEILRYGPDIRLDNTGINWPWDRDRTNKRIPLAYVSENDKEYLIRVELPGVLEKDVKVTVWGSTLTIRGDREFKVNQRADTKPERARGSFLHSMTLPDNARPAQINFEFKEGVLIVNLAKN